MGQYGPSRPLYNHAMPSASSFNDGGEEGLAPAAAAAAAATGGDFLFPKEPRGGGGGRATTESDSRQRGPMSGDVCPWRTSLSTEVLTSKSKSLLGR